MRLAVSSDIDRDDRERDETVYTVYATDTDCVGTQEPMRERWVNLAEQEDPLPFTREQVRRAVADYASASCVDDTVLIASELVTNALRHTDSGPDCLAVDVYQDVVVVWVHDAGSDVDGVRACAERSGDLLAESGRGLLLVEALAARWYVQPTAIGKAVVAVVGLDDAPAVSAG
ncbi:ATP-binding protein [Streptomyces sp. NPDC051643]|uniref:ATP-binding protein n=1 Tax=Streptomyces sp. NPDC051643 TaxID=3365665 RepID=UPI00379A1ABF